MKVVSDLSSPASEVIRTLVVTSPGRLWARPAPRCHTGSPTAPCCTRESDRLASLNRAAR